MRTTSVRLFALMILLAAFFLAPYALAGSKTGQDISGKYLKETDDERAEIEIKKLPNGRVHVTGISDWGITQKHGPNIRYSEKIGKGQQYRLQLTPTRRGLSAKEEHGEAKFGLNATFEGEYKKVQRMRAPDRQETAPASR
jgi:hypothetical protein